MWLRKAHGTRPAPVPELHDELQEAEHEQKKEASKEIQPNPPQTIMIRLQNLHKCNSLRYETIPQELSLGINLNSGKSGSKTSTKIGKNPKKTVTKITDKTHETRTITGGFGPPFPTKNTSLITQI
jgi:hypothetical protein